MILSAYRERAAAVLYAFPMKQHLRHRNISPSCSQLVSSSRVIGIHRLCTQLLQEEHSTEFVTVFFRHIEHGNGMRGMIFVEQLAS